MTGVTITKINIDKCPRCGKEHKEVPFRTFVGEPVKGMDMWAVCPQLSEPLLANITLEKIVGSPLEYLQNH